MASFITEAELRRMFDTRRIDELSDDGSGSNTAIITDAISAASDEVFAKLSKQYTAAQLSADNMIKRYVGIMAMYFLESRRADVPEGIARLYMSTQEGLAALQDGTAKLNAVPQVLPRINPTGATNVFEVSDYFGGLVDIGDGDSWRS